MKGNLVIVESPTKARTIQKYLGEDFIVKASHGHIRDLDEKTLSIDINNGFTPNYVIPAGKKRIVSDLKAAAQKAETVWLASDEDREGEAISWHLVETLGLDPSRTKRIAFHEITKNAILEAIKKPRNIDMALVDAQQARRVLDRLVGFELSPILWRKIQRGLSAGRVQSVALRLVVDREREILGFESTPYYKVDGIFKTAGGKVKGTLDTRFNSLEEARTFLEDSIGANYTVDSIDKKEGTRYPAAPFTTSTLQQEAAAKLHFPVSVTMRVAQSLYERGLITYMRTDSTNLSSLAIGTSEKFIIANYGKEYSHPRQYKTKSKGAQEAHEAIRPTFIENTEIEGTAQEKKLYQLIWKRTVASQMAEASVMNTTVKLASDKRSEKYEIQSTQVLFDGFLKLYIETEDEEDENATEAILPEIKIGEKLTAETIEAACKFTQPPLRYSERTLVKKLEELGIGRPSTYAPTISTLTTGRGYIVKGDRDGEKREVTNLKLEGSRISSSSHSETIGAEKGKLLPQEIGIIVTDYLVENFANIMGYDFTADVEQRFDSIADGKLGWNSVISEFYSPFHSKVNDSLSDRQFSHVERVIGTAPDGDQLIARFGQYGPYVQKGDGEGRQCASLAKGQLIESLTVEDALKLFELPRIAGQIDGVAVEIKKGKYGPYIKYGDSNVSIPRGKDPLKISLEECRELIKATKEKPAVSIIREFPDSGISIINGKFGPYLKKDGSNYKIPKGSDPEALGEKDCIAIIESSAPTARKFRKFSKKK